MGQSPSKAQAAERPPWPEVQSLEQFQDRFRQLYGKWGFFPPDLERLDANAAKFGVTEDGSTYWTESSLANFLAATLPVDLQDEVKTAAPLLYRCMLRLASFPYLNQPALPLTNTSVGVALNILLRRHVPVGRSIGTTEGYSGTAEYQDHWMRSVLFQSMREAPSSSPAEKEATRTEADDRYVLGAHLFLSGLNNRHPKGHRCVIEFGPPIIPVAQLPSSNSADYSGAIPRDQFKSFVRVCIELAQKRAPEDKDRQKLQVPTTDDVAEISWEDFNAVIDATGQKPLLDGLDALFYPFISPTGDVEPIGAAIKETST